MAEINKIEVSGVEYNISAPYEVVEDNIAFNFENQVETITLNFNKENYNYNNKYISINISTLSSETTTDCELVFSNTLRNCKFYIYGISNSSLSNIYIIGGKSYIINQFIKDNTLEDILNTSICNYEDFGCSITLSKKEDASSMDIALNICVDEIGLMTINIIEYYEL